MIAKRSDTVIPQVMVTMLFKIWMCCIGFVRQITFRMELVPQFEGLLTHECNGISWDRGSDDCINVYAEATKFNLKNVNIPYDAFICNNVNCTDDAHISAINQFYANIIESMKNASDELVSRPGRTKPYKRRPGRNAMPEISMLLPENAL